MYSYDPSAALKLSGLADEYDRLLPHATEAWGQRRGSDLALLSILDDKDDLTDLGPVTGHLRGFDDVVFMGTGGSYLGARAINDLTGGAGAPDDEGAPQVHFTENLDPYSFDAMLADFDLERTAFVAVSKSGTTAETLCQCLAAMTAMADPALIADRFVVLSEDKDSPLIRLGQRHGLKLVPHHTRIGGRFSVLSTVGLLPAAVLGHDPHHFRTGAKSVRDANADQNFAPVQAAALAVAAINTGLPMRVQLPYVDRLDTLAFWFRQLWAESLGKQGKGSTPIAALGPVDQHSQLQLYLDGPNDKLFTLIGTDHPCGPDIDLSLAGGDAALDWLKGRTMGDLAQAEYRATTDTLIRHDRPVAMIHAPVLDGATLGALFLHFQIETIIAADLLGVDPFDQPAVEEGKVLTRQYLAEMAD